MSKVTTGTVRLSYCNLFVPRAMDDDSPEKYSVTLLIPKSDKKTIAKVKAAIKATLQEGIDRKMWRGKIPANYWNPLRDGDEIADEHPEYEDMFYLSAKSASNRPPIILDRDKNEILDQTEVYSGCWAQASISFFPFDNKTKGVGVGLNAVRKMRDDEPFGSVMTVDRAAEEFDGDDDDDFDDDLD